MKNHLQDKELKVISQTFKDYFVAKILHIEHFFGK